MKKVIRLITVILLSLVISCNDKSGKIKTGFIDTKVGMKMRENAGTSSKQIGYIPNRAEIKILNSEGPEETIYGKKNRWMQVRYADTTGWVFGAFIKLVDNNVKNTNRTTGIIDAKSGMKMRENAGTSFKQIGYIPHFSEIEILDQDGPEETIYDIKSKWFKVKYQETTGWVFGGYVKITGTPKVKTATVKTESSEETRKITTNIDLNKISESINELLTSYHEDILKNIAIYPFKGQKHLDQKQLRLINNLITKKIVQDKRFNFVEREFLSSVIREHELQQTGLTSTVSEIGKIAGAQMLLVYQIKDGIFDCRILDSETALVKSFSGINLIY